MKKAPLKKVLEKTSEMPEIFYSTLLLFAFGVGLYIFAVIQVRKYRRSQSK